MAEMMGVEATDGRHKDWFTGLYHDNYRMLLAYARRRVDEQTADEVVADTFLVAWRRRDEVPEGFERAWLFGVARNTILTAARSARRLTRLRSKMRSNTLPPWADSPPEITDQASALLPALQSLREADREILMLVAWDEMSHTEIGEAMGISPNAVAIRVHRARKRLADRMTTLSRGRPQSAGRAVKTATAPDPMPGRARRPNVRTSASRLSA